MRYDPTRMRSDKIPILFFGPSSDLSPPPGRANSFMPVFFLVSVFLEHKWFCLATFPHQCFHQAFQDAARGLSNIFTIPFSIFMIPLTYYKINLVNRYVLESFWVKEMSGIFGNVISASWLAVVNSFKWELGNFCVASTP